MCQELWTDYDDMIVLKRTKKMINILNGKRYTRSECHRHSEIYAENKDREGERKSKTSEICEQNWR